MKKLLILLLLLFLTLPSVMAQVYVNRKDINKMEEVVYIELIMDRRLFSRGLSFAIIDYGQVIRSNNLRLNRVTNAEGQDLTFKGEMDIFNFLYRQGWIHETTYAKENYVYHIFRRKGLEK